MRHSYLLLSTPITSWTMDEFTKRNRSETERKLIRAVGEVFRKDGYAGLKLNKVARQAGVHKNLIYRYFGNVQELFKIYILEQDYWSYYRNNLESVLVENQYDNGMSLSKIVLQKQLEYFYTNTEMQRLIHWEISERNAISRGVSDERERIGEEMLKLTDEHFQGSQINFRIVLALLIAGIYYFVLHGKVNGSTFCGIDINDSRRMDEISKTLQQIVEWAYEKASSKG